jgi:hypothetical protein
MGSFHTAWVKGCLAHDNRARQVHRRKQPPRSSGLAAESGQKLPPALQNKRNALLRERRQSL